MQYINNLRFFFLFKYHLCSLEDYRVFYPCMELLLSIKDAFVILTIIYSTIFIILLRLYEKRRGLARNYPKLLPITPPCNIGRSIFASIK